MPLLGRPVELPFAVLSSSWSHEGYIYSPIGVGRIDELMNQKMNLREYPGPGTDKETDAWGWGFSSVAEACLAGKRPWVPSPMPQKRKEKEKLKSKGVKGSHHTHRR